jgi:cellulose synthase/poly-beta-1,6-N-acetylglucosamine synthase-like glycosyltransferase
MAAREIRFPQGLKVAWQRFPEPVIDVSRDKAFQMARQSGARWLFFVDSDIIPPPDVLERLMRHDKPIVSGLYVRRHNPPFNELLRFREDGSGGIRPLNDNEFEMGSLVEVDCVPTGCLLIQTDVMDKVKPFQLTIDGQPARPAHFLWTEWRMGNGMSEDFSFATRAKRQGVPIFCDTSVILRHIGPIKFLPGGNGNLNLEFMGERGPA